MNTKRPSFFNTRKRPNRLSGAVRKPPPGAARPEKRLPPLVARYKKPLLIGGAILGIVGLIGTLLFSRPPESGADKSATPTAPSAPASGSGPSWRACLSQWPDGTLYPELLPVPVGDYRLSANAQELKPFLAPHGLSKIQIKEPFLIEKNEVTLKAFRRYVASVEQMAPGETRERLKAHIGLHWNKDEAETTPVKGVSWEGATDYAEWLGHQTGCAYALPTREQWGAAALLLDGARENRSKAGILSGEVLKRLLWGVREWSATPCAGGYYLVGEDDFVPLPEVRSATCMPAMLSVAGFRVVIKAAASNDPKTGASAPVANRP